MGRGQQGVRAPRSTLIAVLVLGGCVLARVWQFAASAPMYTRDSVDYERIARLPVSLRFARELKPWGVRKTPTAAYLPQLQNELAAIPGIQMFPVMPSALPGGVLRDPGLYQLPHQCVG